MSYWFLFYDFWINHLSPIPCTFIFCLLSTWQNRSRKWVRVLIVHLWASKIISLTALVSPW
jgi:hypothetical protein